MNPLGFDAMPGLFDVLQNVSPAALAVAIFGSIASLFVRFRRARNVERQQLKWLTYTGGLVGVALAVAITIETIVGDRAVDLTNTIISLALAAVPVAMGIAILRHRLFDIDVVINRTLVYGALTATLGGAYLGLVLLLGLAVGDSGLAVAVVDAGGGGAVPPAADPHPGRRRPPLLPPPLRRRPDARGVRRPPARRDRPRGAGRRPARRRHRHRPARARVAVAEERAMRRLAWAMTAVTVGLAAGTATLAILDHGTRLPAAEGGEVEALGELMFAVMVVAFAALGVLLATRRPRNPIGWILVVSAFSLGVSGIARGWYVRGFYADPRIAAAARPPAVGRQLDLGLRLPAADHRAAARCSPTDGCRRDAGARSAGRSARRW